MPLIRGAQILQKYRSHIKNLGTRTVSTASSVTIAHEYQSSLYKIQTPEKPGARTLCSTALEHSRLLGCDTVPHGQRFPTFRSVLRSTHILQLKPPCSYETLRRQQTNSASHPTRKKSSTKQLSCPRISHGATHYVILFRVLDVEDQRFVAPPPRTATFCRHCVLTRRFRTTTISFACLNSHLTVNTDCLTRRITATDPKRMQVFTKSVLFWYDFKQNWNVSSNLRQNPKCEI